MTHTLVRSTALGFVGLYVLCAGCAHQDESQAAAVSQTPALAPLDNGWPRTYEQGGRTVVLYQPQIDDWKSDRTQLDFRAATAVTQAGATRPVYGVVVSRADTSTDLDGRTVYLTSLVFDVQFPGQTDQKKRELQSVVQEVLSQQSYMAVSLDRILTGLKAENMRSRPVEVSLAPPPMYYCDSAAILVIFTGEPKFAPIANTQLEFAVNTNWTILHDLNDKQYYLLDEESWLTTPDIKSGKWEPAKSMPPDVNKLPATENWDDVRKNLPGKPIKDVPRVIISSEPAELIVTDGPVKLEPIVGTTLQYANNPLTPLFFNSADNYYYYLVAGRWFRTRNLSGGWEAASAQLPGAFAQIPPESPMGFVLASVPGTEQAKDAVLLSQIPHEATIDISKAKVDVVYDGTPQFVSIQDTSMTYAVNTRNQVIYATGQYYCCYQGVWFVSSIATGPWVVCTVVPTLIYTIPPSSPVYNCTYVRVYSSTGSTVVVGYTGGYSGEYVAATGVLMFGAGMIVGASMASSWGHCGPAFYSYAARRTTATPTDRSTEAHRVTDPTAERATVQNTIPPPGPTRGPLTPTDHTGRPAIGRRTTPTLIPTLRTPVRPTDTSPGEAAWFRTTGKPPGQATRPTASEPPAGQRHPAESRSTIARTLSAPSLKPVAGKPTQALMAMRTRRAAADNGRNTTAPVIAGTTSIGPITHGTDQLGTVWTATMPRAIAVTSTRAASPDSTASAEEEAAAGSAVLADSAGNGGGFGGFGGVRR
jgi:hypothetical protein